VFYYFCYIKITSNQPLIIPKNHTLPLAHFQETFSGSFILHTPVILIPNQVGNIRIAEDFLNPASISAPFLSLHFSIHKKRPQS
jgi:hypothetical protein